MSGHALLSPSSASRWLACTPSAKLSLEFPDTAGEAAKEGTLAHSLCELLIANKLKPLSRSEYKKLYTPITQSEYFNGQMLEHCEEFATFVMERYNEALKHTPDAQIYLEQRLNFDDYMAGQFGTGDVIIVADHTLQVIDFKYGKGVGVASHENKQMMIYGLGALSAFDFIYDITEVHMTIYQPRTDNISTYSTTAEALKHWGDTELRTKAALALKGEGDFVPGEHCRFCKVKPRCKALANYNLELLTHEFKEPGLLTDAEIADVLTRSSMFTQWLTAVDEYALKYALAGNSLPGYKLVEGRANRKYADEAEVANILAEAKLATYSDIYKPVALIGITDMEKLLGKKTFEEVLGKLVIKPSGKPTLAPESDKRQPINSLAQAQEDFKDID